MIVIRSLLLDSFYYLLELCSFLDEFLFFFWGELLLLDNLDNFFNPAWLFLSKYVILSELVDGLVHILVFELVREPSIEFFYLLFYLVFFVFLKHVHHVVGLHLLQEVNLSHFLLDVLPDAFFTSDMFVVHAVELVGCEYFVCHVVFEFACSWSYFSSWYFVEVRLASIAVFFILK